MCVEMLRIEMGKGCHLFITKEKSSRRESFVEKRTFSIAILFLLAKYVIIILQWKACIFIHDEKESRWGWG